MHFATYLKTCRENLGMTQEGLNEALYLFDDETFEGVTATTISRWERGVSVPSYRRIGVSMRFFQERFSLPVPCIRTRDAEEIEWLMCEEALDGLFRPRRMVTDLDFGKSGEKFGVVTLRHHPRAGELLELNTMLHRSVNTSLTEVGEDRFKGWIENPANLFVAVTYKSSFLGLLFALRLRPESFDAILRFEKRKADLEEEDFAAIDEEGSVYLLSFFALSPHIATLLFRRYYAHLVAYQEKTVETGFVSSFEEALRLAERFGLHRSGETESDGETVLAYRADLFDAMRSTTALKVLFPKKRGR
ncbi:helix-turn-helix domain-containing protein [Hydrogenimonas sp.]